ncbi:hypothetical protein HKX48_005955 [Thoreauomyces humboldtii]|nr:hypothetical protein HKX48_005955 [Thoreauomyces humboldtii]
MPSREPHAHAEVNLRRLLARFEASIAKPDDDWQGDKLSRQKYHSNLAHLHKLLASVETDPARQRDDTALCEYRQRVEQLEAVLDTNRLLSSVGKTVASMRSLAALPQTGDGSDRAAAADRVLKLQRRAEDELREQLLESPQDFPLHHEPLRPVWTPPAEPQSFEDARDELLNTPKSDLRKRRNPKSPLDYTPGGSGMLATNETDEVDHAAQLEQDRQLHEQLTEELAQQAARLKANTVGFSDLLKKDKIIMDDASDQLDSNSIAVNHARVRLLDLNKTARTTTWMVWITVFAVCIIFVFTFAIMRLFRPNRPSTGSEKEGWLW